MIFCAIFDAATGNISAISNVVPEDKNYIEITQHQYKQFVNNELDYGMFLVVPDPETKGSYKLVEKTKNKQEFDVSKSIHEFDKVYKNKFDEDIFYIIQDNKKNKWFAKAKLNPNYISFLQQTKNFSESKKVIYITQENNPNVLIDKLVINQEDFLKHKEFVIKEGIEQENVSLYTAVVHETYKHLIRE